MLKPKVQTRSMDGILIADFWDCNRLDPAPIQDLRKYYEAHVQGRGRPEIVIDLSGVGFAGSAALGNFMSLHRLVNQNGGRIVFCDVDPTVAEVFRASKLENLFDFVPDRDAALRAIIDHPGVEKADKKPLEKASDRPRNGPQSGIGIRRRRNSEPGPQ